MSEEIEKFDRLRYIGYCLAKMPPDEATVEFDDFIQFAKFKLCMASKRLLKDPIWEEYTPEELLVEYYALLFHTDEEQAKKFLQKMNGVSESDYDWIIAESEKQEATMGDEPDVVSFTPDKLGEE